ncbi:MAG: ROK family protein [Phycisphaerae bacterium]
MAASGTFLAVGIDVGGTDIKAGLVRGDGTLVERRVVATQADTGPAAVLERIAGVARELAAVANQQGSAAVGVGLGMPGSIRAAQGVVVSPPNLPGWDEVQVVEPVARATGLPTVLENDAHGAALGELWVGAGRGSRDLAMLTLGTGIGGAIILDGRLWRGRFENAGELGHTIVELDGRPCRCGQRGCLEAYASARNTGLRAMERLAGGEESALSAVLEQRGELTSRDVHEHALAGDALARKVWDQTCRFLALACVNLQHALNLERIILAGGMSGAGVDLVERVRKHFSRMMWPDIGDRPEIVLATLGNDAGLIGAAWLALEASRRRV